jgi:hypothetical protein
MEAGSTWVPAMLRMLLTFAAALADQTANEASLPRQIPSGFTYKAQIVSQVAFSPDGALLAAVGADIANDSIRLFDVAKKVETHRFGGNDRGYYDAVFSPDGKTLYATGGSSVFPREYDVRAWSVATGKPLKQSLGFIDEFVSIHLAERGRTLIATSRSGRLRLFDAATLEEKRSWAAPMGDQERLVFPADGDRVAFVSETKTVELWDALQGVRLRKITDVKTDQIAFSPDGRLLVCANSEVKRIAIFETASGIVRQEFAGASLASGVMAMSPDNRFLAFTDGDAGSLRDLHIDQEKLRVQRRWLYAAAFSRDGRLFAVGPTGGRDNIVELWDIPRQGLAKKPPLDLAPLWDSLGDADGRNAQQAIWRLTAAAEPAVQWMAERLTPVSALSDKELRKLVVELDSNSFKVRDSARDLLEELGAMARTALADGLNANPSLEARRRLERLLAMIDRPFAGKKLRTYRALEVLERIGTPSARAALRRMADGAPQSEITQDAIRALARLGSEQ